MPDTEEQRGIIGRASIDGLPVIYKFVDEAPTEAKRKTLPWLTVISWKYDGSDNNGMPPKAVNDRMVALEDALESKVEKTDVCEHAISRTGNNLKELIYYIRDRDQFMKALNGALVKHERYPIEIRFYEDREWKEFNELRADFNKPSEPGGADQPATAPESKPEGNSKPQPESEVRPP